MNDIHEWLTKLERRLYRVETEGCPYRAGEEESRQEIRNRIKSLEDNSVDKRSFMYGIGIVVVLEVVAILLKFFPA